MSRRRFSASSRADHAARIDARSGVDKARRSRTKSLRAASLSSNEKPVSVCDKVEEISGIEYRLGANYVGNRRCAFCVWAPTSKMVQVHLSGAKERFVQLNPGARGYHFGVIERVRPGDRYWFKLDEQREFPDPASRFQPNGVHAASAVIDPHFPWTDQRWHGHLFRDYIIYELHVGTFSRAGRFESIISQLPNLKELGITAIEIMPVAQFPGERNWGYDGVYPFAVQNSYGGPIQLKRMVDACHRAGIAVILDVVYNHLGPEGNYLGEFGPYFTDRYHTPWGRALNFDGPASDEVRRYFLENAIYWQKEFHIDALRLDAVHAIRDFSASPFLQELAEATHRQAEQLDRRFYLIAESDLNDARIILPQRSGGWGLDAQWSDDFHHALHVLLTGERRGYYQDFGGVKQLAKVFREGFAFTGEYSAYRRRRHGNSPRRNHAKQFVVCAQNHDQIGNRLGGERLSHLVSFEAQKLAAAAVLLSPFVPLLFMGEEYGESSPFYFFVSHSDLNLIEAVRKGRRQEFAAFDWPGEPRDPQDPQTFYKSKLTPRQLSQNTKQSLRKFYVELIRRRKSLRTVLDAGKESIRVREFEPEKIVAVGYDGRADEVCLVLCFAEQPSIVKLPLSRGRWKVELDSALRCWGGQGTLVPKVFFSKGEAKLTLRAQSAILLRRLKRKRI